MTPTTLPDHIEEMCVILKDDRRHPVAPLIATPYGMGLVDFWDKAAQSGGQAIITVRLKDDTRTEDNSDTWDLLLVSRPIRIDAARNMSSTALIANGCSLQRVQIVFSPDGGALINFRG